MAKAEIKVKGDEVGGWVFADGKYLLWGGGGALENSRWKRSEGVRALGLPKLWDLGTICAS